MRSQGSGSGERTSSGWPAHQVLVCGDLRPSKLQGVRTLLDVAEDEVVLRLSRDEALVLFEWLYRTDKTTNDFVDLVEDQAEQRALWNLTCLLKRELVEPYLCRRHTGSRLRLVPLAVRPMASVRARTAPVSIGRMAE